MAFTVGMKVVCVRKPKGGYGDEIDPAVGEVYTIRAFDKDRDDLGLLFAEIRNEERLYTCPSGVQLIECSFNSKNFRPIVSRKTDISIFKAMLKPTEVNA